MILADEATDVSEILPLKKNEVRNNTIFLFIFDEIASWSLWKFVVCRETKEVLVHNIGWKTFLLNNLVIHDWRSVF